MTKVVVVTGAAVGIGAAIALLAASRGYAVAVNYLTNTEKANALVREIGEHGGKAVAIRANVSSPTDVAAMFDEVERVLGRVTALVNNAAIPGLRAPLVDLTPAEIEQVIAVNLLGTLFCTREAMRRMSIGNGGRGGAIVNLSSIAAVTGGDRLSPYVASKAGINGLTVSLAREGAPIGIRINAVSPGAIETEATASASNEWRERQNRLIPLGRLGTPEEVAATVLWLLSEEASYVSGSVFSVTGGRG